MSNSKTKKILSVAALVLCFAIVAVFVFAFAGCEEEDVNADSDVREEDANLFSEWPTPEEAGFVSKTYITTDITGRKGYYPFETTDSEIVETVYVENDGVTKTSEFDENGVATCIYNGKERYLTLGGGVYDFYPYSYTLAPIAMTAETPEIQVSLIFNREPRIKRAVFDYEINYIEVGSLTGEPLDISETAFQNGLIYTRYHYRADDDILDRHGVDYLVALDTNPDPFYLTEAEFPTDNVKLYWSSSFRYSNRYYVGNFKLGNGDIYSYGFSLVVLESIFDLFPDDDIEDDIETEYDEDSLSIAA